VAPPGGLERLAAKLRAGERVPEEVGVLPPVEIGGVARLWKPELGGAAAKPTCHGFGKRVQRKIRVEPDDVDETNQGGASNREHLDHVEVARDVDPPKRPPQGRGD
jgi:hypothetical protein